MADINKYICILSNVWNYLIYRGTKLKHMVKKSSKKFYKVQKTKPDTDVVLTIQRCLLKKNGIYNKHYENIQLIIKA